MALWDCKVQDIEVVEGSEPINQVYISVVVFKAQTTKYNEWKIQVLAQAADVDRCNVLVPIPDNNCYEEIAALSAENTRHRNKKGTSNDIDDTDENIYDATTAGSGSTLFSSRPTQPKGKNLKVKNEELKAELHATFRMKRGYTTQEIHDFEDFLTWERCVKLLKYVAGISDNLAENTENPLEHMGIKGNRFEMRDMMKKALLRVGNWGLKVGVLGAVL